MPTKDLPPLTFVGVDGCTVESPCIQCQGDCDSNQDCTGTLSCFKRGDGMLTPVPGCKSGGEGDIPGADYCYDATSIVVTDVPSKAPVFDFVSDAPAIVTSPSLSPSPAGDIAPPSSRPSRQTKNPSSNDILDPILSFYGTILSSITCTFNHRNARILRQRGLISRLLSTHAFTMRCRCLHSH